MKNRTQHAEAAAPAPVYSAAEVRADGVLHALGALSAPPAAIALLWQAEGATALVGAALYAVGLNAMIYCSALYNWARESPRKALLRRADRAAIFLLIAGTYSAYLLDRLGEGVGAPWRDLVLGLIWTAALSAAFLEIRHPGRFERTTLALALLIGWCGVVLIGPMVESLSLPVLLLLGAGGLAYSAGVLFHLWRSLPYHNAIWHGFVLTAAACHFASLFIMFTTQ